MSNNTLEIIKQQNVLGKDFKFCGTPENPLFLAKDVAEWIEHTDVSMMLKKVDEDEKVTNIVCTLGGNQRAWFLTEDGLYEVLDSSKLIIITEIANDLGISARVLNKFLETEGIQNKQYRQWKISKEFLWLIEQGYADYEIYSRSFGRKNQQLKWTEKGRQFIVDLVKSKLLDNVI